MRRATLGGPPACVADVTHRASRTRHRIAALCLLVALAGLGAGGAAATASAKKKKPSQATLKRQATKLLRGGRFTRFVGSNTSSTSFDERLHLCSNGRFIYDTVFNPGELGEPDVRRVDGTWSVTSATHKGSVWTARVRGVPDSAAPLVVNFRTDGRRVTIDGRLVITDRSDLCR
jgi:hypothetical protein